MIIENMYPSTQNQAALDRAIALEPGLIDAGTDLREFKYCCEFLSGRNETTKKIPKINSDELRDFIERYAGDYVSGGALIAAAIHLGIKYSRIPDSQSVLLAVSERSLPKLPSSPRRCPMF